MLLAWFDKENEAKRMSIESDSRNSGKDVHTVYVVVRNWKKSASSLLFWDEEWRKIDEGVWCQASNPQSWIFFSDTLHIVSSALPFTLTNKSTALVECRSHGLTIDTIFSESTSPLLFFYYFEREWKNKSCETDSPGHCIGSGFRSEFLLET